MRLIPRSFLWRTILMVLILLIIAQVIVANVFLGNHWSRVHSTLARSLSGEIVTMVNFLDNDNVDAVTSMARDIGINVSVHDKLNRPKHNDNESREAGTLAQELSSKLKRPASIYIDKGKRLIYVVVPTKDNQIATF